MPGPHGTPTIMIVDALDFRRAGIVSLLEPWAESGGLELTSVSPQEAPNRLDAAIDCRMLIISLGGESLVSRENLRNIKVLRALAPEVPLVIVSDQANPDEVAGALNSGAQGFLRTDITPELAMQAFSFILRGGSYFPPAALREWQSRSEQGREPPPELSNCESGLEAEAKRHTPGTNGIVGTPEHFDLRRTSLTARQRAVLEHLCQGKSNKLIARRLGMTEGTVKVHVRQIMRKLGATNRTQAAVCAMGPDPHSTIGPISAAANSASHPRPQNERKLAYRVTELDEEGDGGVAPRIDPTV